MLEPIDNTIPMLHIRKVAVQDAYKECLELFKSGAKSIVAEVKLDGLPCDLVYEAGVLVKAGIRSHVPEKGLCVLEYARANPTVPQHIDFKGTIVIRGVLVLSIHDLVTNQSYFTNTQPKACVMEALSNPHHPVHTQIHFVMIDFIVLPTPVYYTLEAFRLVEQFIHAGGCRVQHTDHFTEEDFRNMLSKANSIKVCNRYDTCGYVVKTRDCYRTTNRDNYFKYMFCIVEIKTTTEEVAIGLEWVPIRTGKISPILTIKGPMGVSTCNLQNLLMLSRCAKRVGDVLLVDRCGTSIPIIRGIVRENPDGAELPLTITECPSCHLPVSVENHLVFCHNPDCFGKRLSYLKYILSRSMLNIELNTPCLLYKILELVETSTQSMPLALFNAPVFRHSIEVYEQIQRNRIVPLYKAIVMLNIPGMSMMSARNLAIGHKSLRSVFGAVMRINNQRERASLIKYWSNPKNAELVKQMDEFFGYGKASEATYNSYICITGSFERPRTEMIKLINNLGFGYHGNLIPTTSAILAGKNPGNVVARATHAKIPVFMDITELKDWACGSEHSDT